MIEPYLEQIKQASTIESLINIQLELLKEIDRLADELASSLTDFANVVQSEKEEGFKKAVSECVYRAGVATGYAHERIRVQIELAKTFLSIISDMVADHRKSGAPLKGNPPASSEASEESSSLPTPEEKPTT